MAAKRKAIVAGLGSGLLLLLSVVLVAAAYMRWREIGWGAVIWLTGYVGMTVIRIPHSMRNRANVVVEAHKDTQEAFLIGGMLFAMMMLPLLHLATGCFALADYRLPAWAMWTGAGLQLPFLWLFWRSHADLGRNWSPGLEVHDRHMLVTEGIYAKVRHPMYAALWLAVLAQPLLIQNWIAGFVVVPTYAAMWFLRVPVEEAMMRKTFGEDYDAYCRRAGRLFPKIW